METTNWSKALIEVILITISSTITLIIVLYSSNMRALRCEGAVHGGVGRSGVRRNEWGRVGGVG